jgi:hypothetical protein
MWDTIHTIMVLVLAWAIGIGITALAIAETRRVGSYKRRYPDLTAFPDFAAVVTLYLLGALFLWLGALATMEALQ